MWFLNEVKIPEIKFTKHGTVGYIKVPLSAQLSLPHLQSYSKRSLKIKQEAILSV